MDVLEHCLPPCHTRIRSSTNLYQIAVVPLVAQPPPLAIVQSPWTNVNYGPAGANQGRVSVTLTV